MKKVWMAAIALIINTAVFAQTRSAISFEIKNLGIKTGGKFGAPQATIKFDPANLAASKIEASVDASTINTDNDTRDDHLRGETYFNTPVYQKILMSSTSFKKKSGDNYLGMFNLTIKGITKPVEVPFTYTTTGNTALFKGSFKINRRDFNVGGATLTLGNEVTLNISAETAR